MIRLFGIVREQVNAEIVHPAHIAMHHELHTYAGAFARLEDHRTDGRLRRSAPLRNFYVGLFLETQGLIAHIGQSKGNIYSLPQTHVSKIDLLLIGF